MKRIFLLSFGLLFFSFLYATEENVVNKNCWETSEEELFPVGDTRGNVILTQKVVKRDCNLTITIQGPCKKWETKQESFGITPDSYNTYITNSNEDSMGQLLATINAYGQLDHLWSGWKGFCISGTRTDFSWMSDPMFWASMAASYALDASNYEAQIEAANASGATTVNAAQNAIDNTANESITNTIGSTVNDWSASVASSVNEALGTSFSSVLGKCLLSYSVDMAQSLKDYMSSDNIACDPVDEFCGDEGNDAESQEQILTMDTTKFSDMLDAHPEYQDYIEVISEENGVTTFRMKRPDEIPDFANSNNLEEMKKLQQKIKDMQFAIQSAVNTAKFATCIVTNGNIGNTADYQDGNNGSGLFSVRTRINAAIAYAPVDPLTKLGLKLAVQLAYSFQSVDTCNNREDAQAEGTRHLKTMESLPHGLCHFVYEDCQDSLLGECILHGYHYCCYDQVLSRVLVEQIKAQLGRDWAHCTGITLRDLKYVSFRQCTDQDKKLGFDGAHMSGSYDPTQSYQYKAKCIDFTDLINYLQATVSKDIDMNDFKEVFDDLNSQAK